MAMFVSKGVMELCDSILERPDDWVQGSYEFVYKNNKSIRIWTAGGASHIALRGNDGFNRFEKRMINKCIKLAIARQTTVDA